MTPPPYDSTVTFDTTLDTPADSPIEQPDAPAWPDSSTPASRPSGDSESVPRALRRSGRAHRLLADAIAESLLDHGGSGPIVDLVPLGANDGRVLSLLAERSALQACGFSGSTSTTRRIEPPGGDAVEWLAGDVLTSPATLELLAEPAALLFAVDGLAAVQQPRAFFDHAARALGIGGRLVLVEVLLAEGVRDDRLSDRERGWLLDFGRYRKGAPLRSAKQLDWLAASADLAPAGDVDLTGALRPGGSRLRGIVGAVRSLTARKDAADLASRRRLGRYGLERALDHGLARIALKSWRSNQAS